MLLAFLVTISLAKMAMRLSYRSLQDTQNWAQLQIKPGQHVTQEMLGNGIQLKQGKYTEPKIDPNFIIQHSIFSVRYSAYSLVASGIAPCHSAKLMVNVAPSLGLLSTVILPPKLVTWL